MRLTTHARKVARPCATLVILVVLTAGTARTTSARAPAAEPIPPRVLASPYAVAVRTDSLSAAIRQRLAVSTPQGDYSPADWKRLQVLYTAQQHRALWIDTAAGAQPLRPKAARLVETVTSAAGEGLAPSGYLQAELRAALIDVQQNPSSTEALARADVLLTAAFVAYASDLLSGQIEPRSVNREWHIDPRDVDIDSALVESLRHASFAEALALLRPQDADYAMLMRELARYRQVVAGGGWARVPSLGVLRPGDAATAGTLSMLMGRLHAEGYASSMPLMPAVLPGNRDSTSLLGSETLVVYDGALAGAVAEYQRRHGLGVDSVVGPNTLASLNRPVEFRLRQIAANLERHRWLPRTRGKRYVLVNVPAFRLSAYDGGQEVLTMNVVVGAEYGGRTTPVFSDSMSYVVFRPYWNVPQGIASRELWPKQRRDPSYFRRNGYEVVRAGWGTYVRQKPASDNALGRVKFIFPNDYAIYLHDTPAQALFAERVRAFSHGCIRVEHPDQLAAFVLGPQRWDIDQVRQAMTEGRENRRVNLERKLPVYIVYFTAYARGGALHFGNDIYDRDDALVRVVRGSAMPNDSTAHEIDGLRGVTRALIGAR